MTLYYFTTPTPVLFYYTYTCTILLHLNLLLYYFTTPTPVLFYYTYTYTYTYTCRVGVNRGGLQMMSVA